MRSLDDAEIQRIARALVNEYSAPPVGDQRERVSSSHFELPPEDEDRVAAAALEILNPTSTSSVQLMTGSADDGVRTRGRIQYRLPS